MTYFKEVKIIDSQGDILEIGNSGEVFLTTENPSLENSIDISQEETIHLEGHQYDYSTYIIPTDSTSNELTITKMKVGGSPGNLKVELYYSESGVIDGSEDLLQTFYSNTGNTEVYNLYIQYTGDGTNAIICKVINLGFGHRNLYFKWEGKLK